MTTIVRKIAKKLLRLARPAYYRFAYGRSFPGARALERAFPRWEAASGQGDVPLSRNEWETQYEQGDWAFLTDSAELARYAVIAAYLHHEQPGGPILDVGCGEGLLAEQLRHFTDVEYRGIDISERAVARAGERYGDAHTTFQAADAESFEPDGTYGALVFNECLYYLHDPLGTVERYRRALKPGGRIVVSMFRSPRTEAILRLLARRLPLVETTELANRRGRWTVAVLAGEEA